MRHMLRFQRSAIQQVPASSSERLRYPERISKVKTSKQRDRKPARRKQIRRPGLNQPQPQCQSQPANPQSRLLGGRAQTRRSGRRRQGNPHRIRTPRAQETSLVPERRASRTTVPARWGVGCDLLQFPACGWAFYGCEPTGSFESGAAGCILQGVYTACFEAAAAYGC